VIQPEIAKMRSGGQAGDQSGEQNGSPGDAAAASIADYASGAPSGAFPGQSFDKVVDDIQRYGVKSPPDDGGQ
jgi:hypothetical protein